MQLITLTGPSKLLNANERDVNPTLYKLIQKIITTLLH